MKFFKRKSKNAGLPEAKVLRRYREEYSNKIILRENQKTLDWVNKKLAPYLTALAKSGADSYDIRDFQNYDRTLVIATLKSKGYEVDEFGETITIYW